MAGLSPFALFSEMSPIGYFTKCQRSVIELENGKPRVEIGLIFRTLKVLGITLAGGGAP